MRQSGRVNTQYGRRFFRISLCHNTLENYFITNFNMMQHYGYSLTELENMWPWEREIYVGLLLQHIEDEKLRMEQERKQ